MFPTGEEVRRGLAAVLPLFSFKASGLGLIEKDRWTAWRSFLAGVLALPPFVIFILVQQREMASEPLGFHFFAVWFLTYVLLWGALPLILLEVGRNKSFAPRLPHFIATYNWLLLPIAYLRIIIAILPEPLNGIFMPFFIFYVFGMKWYLARKSLDISGWGATAIVALGFFLSLNIVNIAFGLTEAEIRLPERTPN